MKWFRKNFSFFKEIENKGSFFNWNSVFITLICFLYHVMLWMDHILPIKSGADSDYRNVRSCEP